MNKEKRSKKLSFYSRVGRAVKSHLNKMTVRDWENQAVAGTKGFVLGIRDYYIKKFNKEKHDTTS